MKALAKKYSGTMIVSAIVLFIFLFASGVNLIVQSGDKEYALDFEDTYQVKLVSVNDGITTVKNSQDEPMICATPAEIGHPLHCSAPGSTSHGTK